MSNRLAKAQATLTELRAAGAVKRVSRAKALSDYYRELAGVDACVWPDKRGAIDEWKANVAAAKGTSLKEKVEAICFECVGAGADPAPKLAVRDCAFSGCPLRSIRPWQSLKGRSQVDQVPGPQI